MRMSDWSSDVCSSDLELSDTKIRFTCGELILVSKLIDGAFPEYERVIPRDNDKVMEVDSKAFAAAVDRVATISTEKSRAVKLALKPDGIELSARSEEHTSELQSLMRISYAVFCLKKKKKIIKHNQQTLQKKQH